LPACMHARMPTAGESVGALCLQHATTRTRAWLWLDAPH
jgi:hypothetical protein